MSDEVRLAPEGDHSFTFLLNRGASAYTRIPQGKPFQHGARGIGLEWRVGLVRRRTVFLAIIADDSSLWLRVGALEFDLFDTTVEVIKSTAIPFVRRFEVWKAGDRCVSEWYWAYGRADVSKDDDDLPGFIVELTQDRVHMLRILLRYRASGDGRNFLDPQVSGELETQLRRLIAS